MSTYYVHQKNGDDANDGLSIANAFKTVDQALSTYIAGDTIKIKGGYTYDVTAANFTTKEFTMRAWSDDRPGYEPILTWDEADHLFEIADTRISNKQWYFYNITFYRSGDIAGIGCIYWNPGNSCNSDLNVYGCNFISDWDPVTSDWSTESIYGIYVSNSSSANISDMVNIDYCSFAKISSGVFGYFHHKSNALIDRCIFYMCGDSDDNTKAAIVALRRSGISSSAIVLTISDSIYSGCGEIAYDDNDTNLPSITSANFLSGIAQVRIDYPFRNLEVFDFRQPDIDSLDSFDYGSYGDNSTKLLVGTEYILTMISSFVKPFASRIIEGLNWFTFLSYGKYDAFDIKSDYDDSFFAYWDAVPSHITIDDSTDKDTFAYLLGNVGDGAIIEAVSVPYGDIPGWADIEGTKLDDYSSGGNRKVMTSAKHDIIIEQGANFKRSLIWKDENADPVNLTGYSAKMSIRKKKSDTSALLTIKDTGGSPEITLGGAAGTIDIDILASNTGGLDFTWGYYDLELTDGSSNVTRILQGRVQLNKQVTLDAD